jgi:predicted GNAT family acetyltransferase
MQVIHETNGHKGIFYCEAEGKRIAKMVYHKKGEEKIIITHTEVAEEFGGTGLGKLLVKAGVDFARKNNIKIIPECPYAKKVLESSMEYADVLAADNKVQQ